MTKVRPATEGMQDYAAKNNSNAFDKVVPEQPIQLTTTEKRIPYRTRAGTTQVIRLKKKHSFYTTIFVACASGFKSDWFNEVSNDSKQGYFDKVRLFFDWINTSKYKINKKVRYNILKEFEAYEMNNRGMKYSPLGCINKVIREGLACPTLTHTEYEYLQVLLSLSKPAKNLETEPYTLTSWFDLPWLRQIIGEQAYLQLESPRLLFRSFRVTIATTLLWLLEQRQRWKQTFCIEFDSSYTDWQYEWNRLILQRNGNFRKDGSPADEFSHFLLLDLIKPNGEAAFKERISQKGLEKLPRAISNSKFFIWQRPCFFHPDYQTRYSDLEELLCAWLIACEGIQPTDIPKLKIQNYACEYSQSGRLLAMECTYYKGRSGAMKQPAVLMANEIWTQALHKYLKGLSQPGLFITRITLEKHIAGFRKHSDLNLLLKIWRLSAFQEKLDLELKGAKATQLFLLAILGLEHGDESYKEFHRRTGKLTDEYRSLVRRQLPISLFSLTHIKNTAIHAESDSYRESDLVNNHSHTALTEKASYLTDANKEWVNQAGRITRLVLNDLQNIVYRPSVTLISDAVKDLDLRTKIIKATSTKKITIHSLSKLTTFDDSNSTILVSDTADTALYFIHYIKQAETFLPKLLAVRPDWVERTLIVQVEWMTRTLTRMRFTATAKKTYSKLSVHLPPLFEHILETTE